MHRKGNTRNRLLGVALLALAWSGCDDDPDLPFEDDVWELYHVAEDFSECTDLATQHPEKLRELIDLWWAEAEKYNVLPLDSRMQARMAEPKPLAARPSGRYVYYPGGAPSFEYTAVNVKNRSHTITAYVEIPEGGAEGVLLAHGSWFAGYALYVQDGRLHYVHNFLGLAEYRDGLWQRATPRR